MALDKLTDLESKHHNLVSEFQVQNKWDLELAKNSGGKLDCQIEKSKLLRRNSNSFKSRTLMSLPKWKIRSREKIRSSKLSVIVYLFYCRR